MPEVRCSASRPNGGTPEPVTDARCGARRNTGIAFPTFLPDGEHFLYAALPGKNGKFDIFAGSLADKSRKLVASLEAAPVYAEPGWLLYARQGVLVALPFDARALKITGDPVMLEDEPSSILDPATSWTAGWSVSVSDAGSLGYYSAPSTNTIATWYDATGDCRPARSTSRRPLRVDRDLAGWHARCAGAIDVAVRINVCGSSIWPAAARHRSPPGEGATTRRSGRPTARVSCGPPIATARRTCS